MAKIPFPSGLPTGPISQEAPLSGGEIAQIVSPTRAAGELAGSLTRIGGQFFEQVGRATAAREISEVKAFITGQITDMKAHVDENSDYLNYPKEWDKRKKAIGERIAGVKGGGARRALQNLWAGEAVVYQGNVDQWTRDKSFEADDVAAQNRIDGIINNLSLAEAEGVIAQNFAATGIGEGSEFTQQDVQLQLIEQEIAQRARWGPKKADAIRDAAIKDLLAAGEVNRMDAIYRELSALGPNEALKALTQIEGLTTAQRNGLEARFAGDMERATKELEVAREKDRDEINKLKTKNDLAGLQLAIESSSLDETEQGRELQWVANETRRIAKGEEIVVNVQALENAKNIADSIALQRATFKETADLASELRYGENPLIDDVGFSAIMSIARSSLKAGEAASRSAAYSTGVRQIVGIELPPADITTPEGRQQILAQISEFAAGKQTKGEKLQWQLVGEYMDEMREWFANNPDKIKESYQVMTSKAQLYKGIAELSEPVIEALREVSQRTGQSFSELAEDKVSPKTFKKGDTLTRGGKKYRIVDFDTDGEPLVEEVK